MAGRHLRWGHAVRAGRSPVPRAVFVRHRLGLQMGGLTSAVLARIRLFDSAGEVHDSAWLELGRQVHERIR